MLNNIAFVTLVQPTVYIKGKLGAQSLKSKIKYITLEYFSIHTWKESGLFRKA